MTTVRFLDRLDVLPAAAWDALRPDDNPFLAHTFLAGLERHGCLRRDYGWQPHHLTLFDDERLIAAAPLYIKDNSHGEFVFDWAWAEAYTRGGLDYYPKLLCAVPYAPVTGPRFLAADATSIVALAKVIRNEVQRNGLSSAHLNFVDAESANVLEDDSWLARFDWQFHWHNQGYRDFDDFLDALIRKKRKNIRQERAHVARAGVSCEILPGGALGEADWTFIHCCYLATFAEKGNYPTLTLPFLRHLGATMPDQVLAVIARRGETPIATALLLRSRDTLYGRYWGALEHVPGLHFETCYYQGIDYCIRHGLARFEPGAQGEHKLARGFLPARTRSLHWLADARFRSAIRVALVREARVLDDYHAELMRHSPYAPLDT